LDKHYGCRNNALIC